MKAVLVTTEFRGVFFGYMGDGNKLPEQVMLKNARNCIHWSSVSIVISQTSPIQL